MVKGSALHFKNLRLVNSRWVTIMKTRWLEREANVTRVFFKPLSRLKRHSRQRMQQKGTLQALETRDMFYTLLTSQLVYSLGFNLKSIPICFQTSCHIKLSFLSYPQPHYKRFINRLNSKVFDTRKINILFNSTLHKFLLLDIVLPLLENQHPSQNETRQKGKWGLITLFQMFCFKIS